MAVPNSSGTYNFSPSMGELVLYAFNLIGVRSTAIIQEHMESARMATNLLLGRWSAMGVNLWQVDLQTIPLVQGVSTYSVPANTIVMLDSYVVQNSGFANINRIILPISRSEYASYPNPQQQGFPTTYWMDRLLSPTVTLWPVPDGTQSALNYYRLRQSQDSNFTDAQAPELPYFWLESYAFGLALRLAMIWALDRVAAMKVAADESYAISAAQSVETAQQYISPQISGYFSA